MRKSSLRFCRLELLSGVGRAKWQLIDLLTREPISAFEECMADASEKRYRTRLRYATALAYFFDYLLAVNALSGIYQQGQLSKILISYPALLAMGSEEMAAALRLEEGMHYLANGVSRLAFAPHQASSVSNSLVPVNRLMALCAKIEATARAKAEFYKLPVEERYFGSFQIMSESLIPQRELLHIRQNSVLGSVIKSCSQRLVYRRAKLTHHEGIALPQEAKAFPSEYFLKLVKSATCWRDKVLWLLLGALGIRVSEALNIELNHVDFERQEIYVLNPAGCRLAVELDERYDRFKGRETYYTFPIPSLRKTLFDAIEKYLETEFVPGSKSGTQHLLQYVATPRRGDAYVTVSYENLAKRFKAAASRCGAPLNKYALNPSHKEHSLRHMYGDYLHNEVGVELSELQVMMGHAQMTTTQKYARPKVERLRKKLAEQDDSMFGGANTLLH